MKNKETHHQTDHRDHSRFGHHYAATQPLCHSRPSLRRQAPTNKIFIDVTYDPGTQTYSLGGFSSAELSVMARQTSLLKSGRS